MPFNLKSDIPDRSLPHALQTHLAQQVTSTGSPPVSTQSQVEPVRANESLTVQDKADRLAALTEEINQRLIDLEHKNVEVERQIGEFQALLRQQKNPILGYTLTLDQEFIEGIFEMARERVEEIVSQR